MHLWLGKVYAGNVGFSGIGFRVKTTESVPFTPNPKPDTRLLPMCPRRVDVRQFGPGDVQRRIARDAHGVERSPDEEQRDGQHDAADPWAVVGAAVGRRGALDADGDFD